LIPVGGSSDVWSLFTSYITTASYYAVTEVWKHQSRGIYAKGAEIEVLVGGHDSSLLRFDPLFEPTSSIDESS